MNYAAFKQKAEAMLSSKAKPPAQASFPRLLIGEPEDSLEQEADRIADQVIAGGAVRQRFPCLPWGTRIQRKDNGSRGSGDSSPSVHESLSSPGSPLDRETRAFFEPRFGYDFGNVRIHVDSKASLSAASVNARAYAVGNHLVFGADSYHPETSAGRKLLAHELTHVIQQSSGQAYSNGLKTRNTGLPTLLRKPSNTEQVPATYTLTLKYPPNHEDHLDRSSAPEAATKIRWFLGKVNAHIVGGKEGHQDLIRLHNDQWIVAGISNALGGVSLPPMDIWLASEREVYLGRAALTQGDIPEAARHAQQAAKQAHDAETTVYNYREGTISGAGRAEFGLEVVVVASAAVVAVGTAGIAAGAGGAGALTGLATGATAGGSAGLTGVVAGSAYGAVQQATQQAAEVHGGLRKTIDWSEIGFDALFGIVTGYLGGHLSGKFVQRFLSNQVTATFGRRVAVNVLGDLISGRTSSALHGAAKLVFESARGRGQLTIEAFVDQVISQLFDPRGAFLDLILGAANRRLARSARPSVPRPPSREPVASSPSGTTGRPVHEAQVAPVTDPHAQIVPPSHASPEALTTPSGGPQVKSAGSTASHSESPPPTHEHVSDSHSQKRIEPENIGAAEKSDRSTRTNPNDPAHLGTAPGLTREQALAAKDTMGQPLTRSKGALGEVWHSVGIAGEKSGLTKSNSRKLFNNQRKRFWKAVFDDPGARAQFEKMGCKFEKRGNAPTIEVQDPHNENKLVKTRITLDHIHERQTQPGKALDADNIRLSFTRENTVVLRQLHDQDPFQNPAKRGWVPFSLENLPREETAENEL